MGIYLHWNGGRDSVSGFLKYCELQGFRAPDRDNYGWARLCQVIANFFGGDGLSIGVGPYGEESGKCCDNGTYLIADWHIVGRRHFEETEQNEYDLEEFLIALDGRQPANMQLGTERIKFCMREKTTSEFANFALAEIKRKSKFWHWNTKGKRELGYLVLAFLEPGGTITAENCRTLLSAAAQTVAQRVTSRPKIFELMEYCDYSEKREEYDSLPPEELARRLARRAEMQALELHYMAASWLRGEHFEH